MGEVKYIVGFKGKSYQKTADNLFEGKTIGDKISGDLIGLKSYELEITGGSDKCGFPMRKSIEGSVRKRGFFGKGVGVKKIKRKGMKIRKTVVGNTISENIRQINFKVLKKGSEDLDVLMPKESKKK